MIRYRPWRRIRLLSISILAPSSLHFVPFDGISHPKLADVFRSFGMKTCGRSWNSQFKFSERLFSSQALADAETGGWSTIEVPLAQTGEGIAECELLQWFIQEGEEVEEFQPLCQVQSDKATIDITSRYTGRISEILYVPGDIVKVGATLVKMIVRESHSQNDIQSHIHDYVDDGSSESELENVKSSKVFTTPAIRHLARQHQVDLSLVSGSGQDGRILKDDVLNYVSSKGVTTGSPIQVSTKSSPPSMEFEEQNRNAYAEIDRIDNDTTIPLRGFQRAMVKSMTMAAKVPHFHYVEQMSCHAMAKLKVSFQAAISDKNVKCTFLPLLIKCLSVALRDFPWMNSCFHEESLEVTLKGSHNIGVAMATSYGLVVPNIKNVQSLSIFEIIEELLRLQILASNNKLSQEDVSDGTITLSNIGSIGGKFGTPLVNMPEAAIIALGRIQKVASFDEDGNVFPDNVMTVCIGADHRIVDGATVARFCNEWKRLIENPELLMLNMR